jgi:aryl-alcohol dehydrogenase-like predicted oxidoreductase
LALALVHSSFSIRNSKFELRKPFIMQAMKFSRLGNTGTTVSRLCLGCMTYGTPRWRPWVLDEESSRPFIRRALEAGINFFDTADMYSDGASEEVVGRALSDFAKREEYVLATKVFFPTGPAVNDRGLGRKHILAAIDASLRRLRTDYVDLYQIHRFDPETAIEETLEALHDVVKAGKARYIGASSMFAWQFARMLDTSDRHGWTRFITMQNHYNLVYREEEREMIPLCLDQRVGLVPWSPLARGFLAGNRARGQEAAPTSRAQTDEYAHSMYYSESDFDVVDRVVETAKRRGVKPAQIALAWILHRPGVTSPIVGASKLEQLEDAIAAVEIELSAEEMAFLEESYRPHRVLGHK